MDNNNEKKEKIIPDFINEIIEAGRNHADSPSEKICKLAFERDKIYDKVKKLEKNLETAKENNEDCTFLEAQLQHLKDYKKLIDISPIYKATFPFRFSREASELWKTFNTCVLCKTERQCFDVLFRGEKARMCESCIDKFELFPVKTGIKRRKDDRSSR